MKIKEYAEEKNVSQNGLYKSIRRAGYSAKELTDKKGDITSRGFSILSRIFPDGGQDQKQREPEKEIEQINGRLLELEKDREEQKKRATEEKARADKWERLYLELQGKSAEERAESAQQIKALQVLLSQQQEINRRLLMNPIKRLFAGHGKEKNGE